jgi:hypothetical protein
MKRILFLSLFLVSSFLAILARGEQVFNPLSPSSGGTWNITALDNVDAGLNGYQSYTSIAIDSDNDPHISYRGAPSNSLRYIASQDQCWATPELVYDSGWSMARENSLALDAGDLPHISFSYRDGGDEDLHYAVKNGAGTWTVIPYTAANTSFGMENDLALDSAGDPHFSHWEWTGGEIHHTTYLSSTWNSEILGTGTWDKTSIAMDSNDDAHLVYHVPTTHRLYYGTNQTGGWVWTDLDVCTGYTFQTSCGPSLALDTNDNVHISYSSGTHLKYASIISGTVITPAIVAASVNPGKYHAIAVDAAGNVHISYHHSGQNNLWYATNASGTWVSEVVDPTVNAGRSNAIAVDSNGFVHISYRDETTSQLKYATNNTLPSLLCTPTPTPSDTPEITPSITPTVTPTGSNPPSLTPLVTSSVTPSMTISPTASATPSPSVTSSPTPSETASLTPSSPTEPPSLTPSPTASQIPPGYKVFLPFVRK